MIHCGYMPLNWSSVVLDSVSAALGFSVVSVILPSRSFDFEVPKCSSIQLSGSADVARIKPMLIQTTLLSKRLLGRS